MLDRLRTAMGALTGRRSFEAAGTSRQRRGMRQTPNLNAAILAAAQIMARRSTYAATNNPWATSGLDSLVANLVGTGIKPRSLHPDDKTRARLMKLWANWVKVSDPTGRMDFYGQTAVAVRAMIQAGDVFGRIVPRHSPRARGRGVPMSLEILHRDQLAVDLFQERGNGARIRAGIEFSADGARIAYHIRPTRPNDPLVPFQGQPIRIPADDLVHLFRPLEPGQLLGISRLSASLTRLSDGDEYEAAALVKGKLAAMLAGFITDPEGRAAEQFADLFDGEIGEMTLEPGTLQPLPSGAGITFSEPPQDSNYPDFTKDARRGAAAGMGVTYEQLSGDYSGVTYSSVRASLVEFRRRAEQDQHLYIVPMFIRPIYERFVTLAVLSGELDAPDFEAAADDYLAAEFLCPRWEHVDPSKDVSAEIQEIEANLKSRTQAIAERGYDAEELDREIAADRRREATLPPVTPVTGEPGSPATEE